VDNSVLSRSYFRSSFVPRFVGDSRVEREKRIRERMGKGAYYAELGKMKQEIDWYERARKVQRKLERLQLIKAICNRD